MRRLVHHLPGGIRQDHHVERLNQRIFGQEVIHHPLQIHTSQHWLGIGTMPATVRSGRIGVGVIVEIEIPFVPPFEAQPQALLGVVMAMINQLQIRLLDQETLQVNAGLVLSGGRTHEG